MTKGNNRVEFGAAEIGETRNTNARHAPRCKQHHVQKQTMENAQHYVRADASVFVCTAITSLLQRLQTIEHCSSQCATFYSGVDLFGHGDSLSVFVYFRVYALVFEFATLGSYI